MEYIIFGPAGISGSIKEFGVRQVLEEGIEMVAIARSDEPLGQLLNKACDHEEWLHIGPETYAALQVAPSYVDEMCIRYDFGHVEFQVHQVEECDNWCKQVPLLWEGPAKFGVYKRVDAGGGTKELVHYWDCESAEVAIITAIGLSIIEKNHANGSCDQQRQAPHQDKER